MQRPIKFRAWDYTSNVMRNDITEMVFNSDGTLNQINVETGADILFPEKECVLMQYTGLKDKNGVEIYEGDIVEGGFEKHRGVVSFGLYANPFGSDEWTGYQGFYIKWSNERAEMTRGDMGYWINEGMETAIEVIGNIYEKPELLEALEEV